jgi:hypothetical protein
MEEQSYAIILNGIVVQTVVLLDPTSEYLEELKNKYNGDEIILGDSVNAQVGASWDGAVFTLPKPYPSWILDEFFQWIAPVPYPVIDVESDTEMEEGKWWLEDPNKYDTIPNETVYVWDESVVNWVPKV